MISPNASIMMQQDQSNVKCKQKYRICDVYQQQHQNSFCQNNSRNFRLISQHSKNKHSHDGTFQPFQLERDSVGRLITGHVFDQIQLPKRREVKDIRFQDAIQSCKHENKNNRNQERAEYHRLAELAQKKYSTLPFLETSNEFEFGNEIGNGRIAQQQQIKHPLTSKMSNHSHHHSQTERSKFIQEEQNGQQSNRRTKQVLVNLLNVQNSSYSTLRDRIIQQNYKNCKLKRQNDHSQLLCPINEIYPSIPKTGKSSQIIQVSSRINASALKEAQKQIARTFFSPQEILNLKYSSKLYRGLIMQGGTARTMQSYVEFIKTTRKNKKLITATKAYEKLNILGRAGRDYVQPDYALTNVRSPTLKFKIQRKLHQLTTKTQISSQNNVIENVQNQSEKDQVKNTEETKMKTQTQTNEKAKINKKRRLITNSLDFDASTNPPYKHPKSPQELKQLQKFKEKVLENQDYQNLLSEVAKQTTREMSLPELLRQRLLKGTKEYPKGKNAQLNNVDFLDKFKVEFFGKMKEARSNLKNIKRIKKKLETIINDAADEDRRRQQINDILADYDYQH